MAKSYIIREYQSFTCGKDIENDRFVKLDKETFEKLEEFILSNSSQFGTETLEIMKLSSNRQVGKIISAKNYVGVIAMNDGTQIEILPKIYSSKWLSDDETRKIFFKMLKTVKEFPYKTFEVSNLKTEKMKIFEIFIRMFIDEIIKLTKQGLKSNYSRQCSNENFFKGKLKVTDHIKHNIIHKERVYVEYDVFSTNCAENRLIKATIQFLKKQTTSLKNSKELSRLLDAFDEIPISENYEADFEKCSLIRSTAAYDNALRWCKVFLMNKSFTSFAGCEVAYALLFSMDKLFESYMAEIIRKAIDSSKYTLSVQDKKYYLFESPRKQFALKPDIVITNKETKSVVVLDTKWKLLSIRNHNYGISQADMYQMYAYGKKYEANEVVLLYPLNENIENPEENIEFDSIDGVKVKVKFVNLIKPMFLAMPEIGA